jgi:exosortase
MSEAVKEKWRGWTAAGWLALLVAVCYWPVIGNIVHQWQSDDNMAHGWFVPLIVGYIVWERREELAGVEIGQSAWGLGLLIGSGVVACAGALAAEIFTERVALVGTVAGLVWYLGGTELMRRLRFPLLLLCFALPLPGLLHKQITFPLQLVATRLAEWGLELTGRTVLREGNVLELAGRMISVVEACSGIRALMALEFFALAYAYLFHEKVWMRWALAAAAVPVAVVANSGRVMATALLGEVDPRLAEGFYHGLEGWAVFVVAMAMLIGVERVLRRWVR